MPRKLTIKIVESGETAVELRLEESLVASKWKDLDPAASCLLVPSGNVFKSGSQLLCKNGSDLMISLKDADWSMSVGDVGTAEFGPDANCSGIPSWECVAAE